MLLPLASHRTARWACAALLVATILSCGGDGSAGTGTTHTLSAVQLDVPSATIRLGATMQVTARGVDATNNVVAGSVTFTSSDEAVLSVSSSGVVRALRMGSATITAAIGGLQKSAPITIAAGYPAVITKAAGDNQTYPVLSAVAVAPSVLVRDSVGNPVAGVVVTFAPTTGGGTVTGAAATTSATGVATVGGWTLGSVIGENTLTASVGGSTGAVTTIFAATAAAATPSQLVVSVAPSGAVGALRLTVQPEVQFRTSSNTLAPAATAPVTVSISAGGRLAGTTTVTPSGGIARFTDHSILDGGTWTLTFTAAAVTPATAVIVVAPGASIVAPSLSIPATRGDPDPDPVVVKVTSGSAAEVSALAIGSVTYGAGATGWLTASLTAATTPASLVLAVKVGTTAPGTYTAQVTINGASAPPQVVTVTLVVTGLPPANLVLVREPDGATINKPFSVQPIVELRDPNGLLASQSSAPVTARLRSGVGTLTGPTTVNAVNGVATFTDLTLSTGGIVVLSFESPALPVIQSRLVDVRTATRLALSRNPSPVASGAPFAIAPQLMLSMDYYQLVTRDTATITASVAATSGNAITLGGTLTVKTVNGVADFTNLLVIGPPGFYSILFSAPGFIGLNVSVQVQ